MKRKWSLLTILIIVIIITFAIIYWFFMGGKSGGVEGFTNGSEYTIKISEGASTGMNNYTVTDSSGKTLYTVADGKWNLDEETFTIDGINVSKGGDGLFTFVLSGETVTVGVYSRDYCGKIGLTDDTLYCEKSGLTLNFKSAKAVIGTAKLGDGSIDLQLSPNYTDLLPVFVIFLIIYVQYQKDSGISYD